MLSVGVSVPIQAFLAACPLKAYLSMQSSADKALDRLQEPLSDWAALRSDLRITRRVKFLQRRAPRRAA